MEKRYFTIGMAGHIDHGKTSLTKALTNVDTDRLKEEKERQISIELGFAPLYDDKELQISVIDVPGHERFIRQMIAGVAGIDLVVLVVAADEGVMPQTQEHLDILGFLGIKNGIIAITKIDRVEEEFIELVQDDILGELSGTVFENSPFVLVDSLSKKGIEELKQLVISSLKAQATRDALGAFRLPIDQVFTVKGQGTVVRGTVYEGSVEEGQSLLIMPKGREVRARQLQVHHQSAGKAFAGQRVAINLSGVSKEDLTRGDVLVSSEHFIVTNTIDVALRIALDLDHMVKQRMPIKLHIGTTEVMGRIVFFDRNELKEENSEIVCQLRLEEEIVTKRGDRFIIRRPSPQETIGGGWVIDPRGNKYRFGENTIVELEKKKVGTPAERIEAAIKEAKSLTMQELMKRTSLNEDEIKEEMDQLNFFAFNGKELTLASVVNEIEQIVINQLGGFHENHSMKIGMNKAQLLQSMNQFYPKSLLEFVVDHGVETLKFMKNGQFLLQNDFKPHVAKNWQKRVETMMEELKQDGLKTQYLADYFKNSGIPESLVPDLKRFLEEQELVVPLDEQYYYHGDVFKHAVDTLRKGTDSEFEVGAAKEVLDLSRKYMIPFLERLDAKGLTKRVDNKRVWQG